METKTQKAMKYETVIYYREYDAISSIPEKLSQGWAVFCINRISKTIYVTFMQV